MTISQISQYTQKYIDYIQYSGIIKPTDSISDARWRAMVTHINREYGVTT